jgi:hypothetical protein
MPSYDAGDARKGDHERIAGVILSSVGDGCGRSRALGSPLFPVRSGVCGSAFVTAAGEIPIPVSNCDEVRVCARS